MVIEIINLTILDVDNNINSITNDNNIVNTLLSVMTIKPILTKTNTKHKNTGNIDNSQSNNNYDTIITCRSEVNNHDYGHHTRPGILCCYCYIFTSQQAALYCIQRYFLRASNSRSNISWMFLYFPYLNLLMHIFAIRSM